MELFTKAFWLDTAERVIVTIAEFLIVLGGSDGTGLLNMELSNIIKLSLLGGFAALLKAIIATRVTNKASASLVVKENV